MCQPVTSIQHRMSKTLVTNLADRVYNQVWRIEEMGCQFLVAINTLVLAEIYNFTLEKSDLKNLLIISSSQLELAA